MKEIAENIITDSIKNMDNLLKVVDSLDKTSDEDLKIMSELAWFIMSYEKQIEYFSKFV